ncbi:bifunctional 4-hydroxy-2-oxoglutarate aldolase/2-dehydro-3-deoxy-phosphogluconate aldolase [Crocinitomix catalasitica]|uniref:bifunctional 4-hydroxy-2-oxoglutarate aldolase/2-dehydro-3-deoxy-phosphogluconate aldolase n=1 Tax=Crocinitomix catalasitica TaxID=184607 RepID=UPI000A061995|nr:bifunctional 4-hydroxy-2-oxoglutarate aldolase/2-dehydro-3-deoxy-phosphogluconate aldolase [Crocinitomix catalasitica]
MQNNIEKILESHPLIPVVTIHKEEEIKQLYEHLSSQGISCVEITLRTDFAWEAIALFKSEYKDSFKVGVGTITSVEHIKRCVELEVDFMVSPGLCPALKENFEKSGIPFLPGVSTPSEIMSAMELGWRYLKFFPAHLFGGAKALKTYSNVFKEVIFCPTGGINAENYQTFLDLPNVMSLGGSWLVK